MKKLLYLPLWAVCMFLCQACSDENSDCGEVWLYFTIGITDMEGNDLLNPEMEGNIVSNKPTMIDIFGEEHPSTIYTDKSFLYLQGKGHLIINRWNVLEKSHYIQPGGPYGYTINSDRWIENAKIIIKWGEGIENDTIVFSGGWKVIDKSFGPHITHITINGKELEKSDSIAYYGEHHYIYRKAMP